MFQVSQAWQARAGTGAGASPLARLIEQVAIHFYGKPNAAMSSKTELRFHAKGSLSVDLTKATFYDHEIGEGGGLVDMVKRETGRAGADAFEWCSEQGYDVPDDRTNGTGGGKPHIVATYPYTDASGEVRFEVCRYEPKTFKQRQPDGHGGYVWSVKGVKQVPYRLPELAEAIAKGLVVYVVEGEKDVGRLATLGVIATTNAGGAGNWKDDLDQYFAGADVVVIPDQDPQARKRDGTLRFHLDGSPVFPGQDHGRKVAEHLSKVARRVRMLNLKKEWPQCPPKGDISDWLDVPGNGVDQLNALVERLPDWSPEAEAPAQDERPNPEPPLVFINLGALQGQPVPGDEWFVVRRIPSGNVTLLSGDGGTGKTTLALMLCTTTPFGGDWLGSIVDQPGPSMFVTGEETEKEIHKRLARVLAHQQRDFLDIDGKVHIHCRPADDPMLGRPDRYGVIQPTNFFKRIVEAAHDTKPSLICLEAAADLFGGNENDRGQVRQFVGLLRGRLAIACNTTIVLLQHPSQAGIASGSGTSGTTQWNNACRSRLYFKYVSGNGEEKEANRDLRTLEVMKSNLGPRGEIIKARWVDGYFVVEGGGSPLERMQREAQADEAFLRIAQRLLDQGQPLGPNKSPTYAPAKIADHPDAAGISKPELVRAMQRLLDANKVHIVNTGSPSRARYSLRIGPRRDLGL
jgi:RecA-family ATPase